VYATQSRDVRHVVVDGRVRVCDRQLVGVDREALLARARREAARVAGRAGLAVAP
jgi:hypothetical protein